MRIELLSIASLQAAYGPAGAKLLPPGLPLPPPPLESAVDTPGKMKVEIDRVSVARADIAWGSDDSAAGGILGTRAETVTEGTGAMRAMLKGGTFRQSGWPDLPLESATVRYARPMLHLEGAKLRLPSLASPEDEDGKKKEEADAGDISVAGEVRFEEATPLEARLKFTHCPVGPLLPERWRARLLGGRFEGEAKVNAALRDEKAPASYRGSFDARDGTLHEMKMLREIAHITDREEFRRLRLRRVRAEFVWDGHKLTVRNFAGDAGREKLLRVEGEFEIEDQRIDGTFQIGVTPGIIEKIPGARERVFTRESDGYVWTRVRLTGSLDHPHEDLRERLVAAAKAEIANRFLGTLLGPGKEVLKLLEGFEDIIE
ncbi:MAG: hypothetical protein INR62_03770 [Rhodospirillales bacterium]|nr:hypothetical protein [Acetobacter sp.]